MLLASFGVVAVATLMTATSKDANALFAWRVITGIGLGASMPNALALAAEYTPSSSRVAIVTLLAGGLSLGGACSGFLAPTLIAWGGWRAIFATGGAVMLILWFPLLALPESVRFLVARRKNPLTIGRLLERLDPGYRYSSDHQFGVPSTHATHSSVRALFEDGLTPTTIALWIIFFLNLGLLFLLASWLPVLLRARGLALQDALRLGGMFQVGGVIGGFLLAWLIRHWGPYVVLMTTYAATAIALFLLSTQIVAVVALAALLVLVGNGVVGGQAALNALSSSLYPTRARATGVGWALGVGRLGAISAALLGGTFLAARASPPRVFLLAMLLAGLCGCGIAAMRWAVRRGDVHRAAIPARVATDNQ
jgi:AAHS family 4-hydroxybenzoate transporter-like MFS transporter